MRFDVIQAAEEPTTVYLYEVYRDEAGDLLFSMVNVLRHAGIDPESALRMGNRKFERRFRALEQRCRSAGIDPSAAGIDTLEAFWCELKQEEQGAGPDRAR